MGFVCLGLNVIIVILLLACLAILTVPAVLRVLIVSTGLI